MNKKLVFSVCMLCLSSLAFSGETYTINGKVPQDLNGKMVDLSIMAQRSRLPQDSAKIENGAFTLTGEVEAADVAMIYTHRDKLYEGLHVVTVLEPGPVTIDFTSNGFPVQAGGALSTPLNEYASAMAVCDKKAEALHLKELGEEFIAEGTTDERRKEIRATFDQVSKERELAMNRLLSQNMDNVFGAYLFVNLRRVYNDEEAEKLILSAGQAFQAYAPVQRTLAQINAAKVRRVGNHFLDVELPDAKGNLKKLSDYVGKGKYVLLDFWASWCGPCRAEAPHVIAAYKKYHKKGFEVVGISLDSKKEAWLQGIDDLQLPWIHLSDLQGWKNEAAKRYAVNSIPCTLLVDPNGIIIGGDYRGDELAKKLEELFK